LLLEEAAMDTKRSALAAAVLRRFPADRRRDITKCGQAGRALRIGARDACACMLATDAAHTTALKATRRDWPRNLVDCRHHA
jgi:hypothetical protein